MQPYFRDMLNIWKQKQCFNFDKTFSWHFQQVQQKQKLWCVANKYCALHSKMQVATCHFLVEQM